MTTFDPDTAVQDVEVLLRVHRELDGLLALDCHVIRPGAVRVGDVVEIRPGGLRDDATASGGIGSTSDQAPRQPPSTARSGWWRLGGHGFQPRSP